MLHMHKFYDQEKKRLAHLRDCMTSVQFTEQPVKTTYSGLQDTHPLCNQFKMKVIDCFIFGQNFNSTPLANPKTKRLFVTYRPAFKMKSKQLNDLKFNILSSYLIKMYHLVKYQNQKKVHYSLQKLTSVMTLSWNNQLFFKRCLRKFGTHFEKSLIYFFSIIVTKDIQQNKVEIT